MAERAGRALDPMDLARDRPEDPLREREGERDRDEVSEQEVLDHVRGGELLAEAVQRGDERSGEPCDPGPPERQPPVARRPSAALLARAPPPERVHDRVREQREQHERREGPRGVDGDGHVGEGL
jgi:hypothetical protein